MPEYDADFVILHPDRTATFGKREPGERVLDLAARVIADALGREVTEEQLRLGLLSRSTTGPHQLWCVGLDSIDLPANVLLHPILRAHRRPYEFDNDFPRWRGPIVLATPIDLDTKTFPALPDTVGLLIDRAAAASNPDPGMSADRREAGISAGRAYEDSSEAEMNLTRADWACVALEEFASRVGYSPPDLHNTAVFMQVTGDFARGIAALAADQGSDMAALVTRGALHFREELAIELDERQEAGELLPEEDAVAVEPWAQPQHFPLTQAPESNTHPAGHGIAPATSLVSAAEAGLEAFATQTRQALVPVNVWDQALFDEVVSDFIGDLAHLALQKGRVRTVDSRSGAASLRSIPGTDLTAACAGHISTESIEVAAEPPMAIPAGPTAQAGVEVSV